MANSDKGTWIKIYRDIQHHWLWQLKPFSKAQAWIDLIIIAQHSDGEFTPYGSDEVIDGKRGCVYRSIEFLADRWGWNRKTVNRFLKLLENKKMIKVFKKQGSKRTTISIINYDDYQGEGTRKRTSKGQETGQETGQVRDKRGDINNNDKERPNNDLKNEKEAALPVSSDESPAAAPENEDDEDDSINLADLSDEEFERWLKEHESGNI